MRVAETRVKLPAALSTEERAAMWNKVWADLYRAADLGKRYGDLPLPTVVRDMNSLMNMVNVEWRRHDNLGAGPEYAFFDDGYPVALAITSAMEERQDRPKNTLLTVGPVYLGEGTTRPLATMALTAVDGIHAISAPEFYRAITVARHLVQQSEKPSDSTPEIELTNRQLRTQVMLADTLKGLATVLYSGDKEFWFDQLSAASPAQNQLSDTLMESLTELELTLKQALNPMVAYEVIRRKARGKILAIIAGDIISECEKMRSAGKHEVKII